ncbi:hypothetical protein BN1184_BV_01230 [Pantoea ananatis]|nr:hypothetical protein BN1184_BV_01230 [Pantoea ananatis]
MFGRLLKLIRERSRINLFFFRILCCYQSKKPDYTGFVVRYERHLSQIFRQALEFASAVPRCAASKPVNSGILPNISDLPYSVQRRGHYAACPAVRAKFKYKLLFNMLCNNFD